MEQSEVLSVRYFDGKSGRAHPATLRVQNHCLHVTSQGQEWTVPMREVHWPERTRHGTRIARLPGEASLQSDDSSTWDSWCAVNQLHEPWIVKLQQSWRWAAWSSAAMLTLGVGLYIWGIPLASSALIEVTPRSVDARIGEEVLASLDGHFLQPSTLGQAEQSQLTTALGDVLRASADSTPVNWKLVFRHSEFGPNAFALPDGTIVMTDEMVQLVGHDQQVLLGILAHEFGHVQHRHALRMLYQTAAMGLLASVVWGDFNSLLAIAPAALGQASYSRAAEHEADAKSVQLLNAAHISPAVMVTLFKKLDDWRRKQAEKVAKPKSTEPRSIEPIDGSPTADNIKTEQPADAADKDKPGQNWLGIAFASHPADADRVAFFEEAARQR